MSYRRCRALVNEMNPCWKTPLVTATRGGEPKAPVSPRRAASSWTPFGLWSAGCRTSPGTIPLMRPWSTIFATRPCRLRRPDPRPLPLPQGEIEGDYAFSRQVAPVGPSITTTFSAVSLSRMRSEPSTLFAVPSALNLELVGPPTPGSTWDLEDAF